MWPALPLRAAGALLLALWAAASPTSNPFQAEIQATVLREVAAAVQPAESRLSAQISDLSHRVERLEEAAGSRRGPARRDCSDLPAGSPSGVYLLRPGLDGTERVPAFCDLQTDGGNWTVLQRRADIRPREDFYRGWAAYQEGFGELDGEFWWGLDNMWAVTAPRDRQYELKVELGGGRGGEKHAVYQNFRISSESDGYRLFAGTYSGDAGDSLRKHIGMPFDTKDDGHYGTCAEEYSGAWWFHHCFNSHLNGYHNKGIKWHSADGDSTHYQTATMMIQPTKKF